MFCPDEVTAIMTMVSFCFQIGSYFGSELCDVDIDSDGTTDFLMVGAPFYYESQREGRMYVYALTGEVNISILLLDLPMYQPYLPAVAATQQQLQPTKCQ